MFDVSKNLVNYVFDCFMPEMQEEVVKKQSSAKGSSKSEENKEESKYVQMERLAPVDQKP
jgi:hypothetical protein